MPFGQPSGPPATARQLAQLLTLLQADGYATFREARGPLGFTQRQGSGKFTRDEATALIAEFTATRALDTAEAVASGQVASDRGHTNEIHGANDNHGASAMRDTSDRREASDGLAAAAGRRSGEPAARRTAAEQTLRRIPTERLAAELQRRGWIVVEP